MFCSSVQVYPSRYSSSRKSHARPQHMIPLSGSPVPCFCVWTFPSHPPSLRVKQQQFPGAHCWLIRIVLYISREDDQNTPAQWLHGQVQRSSPGAAAAAVYRHGREQSLTAAHRGRDLALCWRSVLINTSPLQKAIRSCGRLGAVCRDCGPFSSRPFICQSPFLRINIYTRRSTWLCNSSVRITSIPQRDSVDSFPRRAGSQVYINALTLMHFFSTVTIFLQRLVWQAHCLKMYERRSCEPSVKRRWQKKILLLGFSMEIYLHNGKVFRREEFYHF